jgi:hypothetical protein
MKRQSPQLKWFKLTIQKGSKTEYKRLLAVSRQKAIEAGNKILKHVPGAGALAKVIDAEEQP